MKTSSDSGIETRLIRKFNLNIIHKDLYLNSTRQFPHFPQFLSLFFWICANFRE